MLLIASRKGKMEAPARITASVPRGVLFLPIHFGENPPNVLTDAGAFDPMAKIPEFKVSAVKIRKVIAA